MLDVTVALILLPSRFHSPRRSPLDRALTTSLCLQLQTLISTPEQMLFKLLGYSWPLRSSEQHAFHDSRGAVGGDALSSNQRSLRLQSGSEYLLSGVRTASRGGSEGRRRRNVLSYGGNEKTNHQVRLSGTLDWWPIEFVLKGWEVHNMIPNLQSQNA
ncbi:hypothetical protein BKA93DRAFT_523572 [Sparassis latifolia]